jgi:hypothetical protein
MTTRSSLALMLVAIASAACAPHRTTPGTATGCCCAFDNCLAGYSQPDCVANAQFQGWTYTWHEGACTSSDRFPAPDAPTPSR